MLVGLVWAEPGGKHGSAADDRGAAALLVEHLTQSDHPVPEVLRAMVGISVHRGGRARLRLPAPKAPEAADSDEDLRAKHRKVDALAI